MARLEGIWIKSARSGPMNPTEQATLDAEGLVDNANRGGHRAVTMITKERWAAVMAELGTDLSPSARRANLLLSDIDLEECAGKTLRIGSCRIRMNGETKPCDLMDKICHGLQDALKPHWGGGAYGTVLDAGEIRVGDEVAWEG